MREKSIKKNAFFQASRTVVNLLFPLISFPYASRVFLVEGMGRFNFASSVVNYFALIAALGVFQYGVREGSKRRDDPEKITAFASELFSINMYATVFAYILLFFCVACMPKLRGYAALMVILSLQMILSTIRSQWIYSVFEDYLFFTVMTVTMQVLAIVLMLLFVRDRGDLYKYAFFSMIAYCGPGLPMFFHLRKYVRLRVILCPPLHHLKPIFLIFAASVATVIYVSSDTTILGWIKGDYPTGLYSTSANIYKIVKEVLLAVVSVTVPRVSYYISKGSADQLQSLLRGLLDSMISLVVPAMVGLFFMSSHIVQLFAGPAYLEAAPSLRILSIALFFATFTYTFMSAILIPFGQEKVVMILTWCSAVINIVLNLVLIPLFADRAAAFTTVVAELFMCVLTYLYARKKVKILVSKRVVISTILGCGCIALICISANALLPSRIMQLVIGVAGSILAYFLLQIVFRNPILPRRGSGLNG